MIIAAGAQRASLTLPGGQSPHDKNAGIVPESAQLVDKHALMQVLLNRNLIPLYDPAPQSDTP